MAQRMTPSWMTNIKERIRTRDANDVIPFRQLIMAYSEAVHREEALLDDMDSMREHQSTLEEQLRVSNTELDAYKSGGGMDKRKYTELQGKYDELKEEQTQLYRSQSAHIQRLLDLNEQLKTKDHSVAALKHDLDQSHSHHDSLQGTIEGLKDTIDEKNMNIQIMQDELTALQLELLQTDDKLVRLEDENKRLMDKCMSKVSETANMLNEQIEGAGQAIESGPGGPTSHCPSTVALSFKVEGKKELINTLVMGPDGEDFAACTTYPAVPIFSISDGSKQQFLWGGPKTGITAGCFNTSGDLFVGTTISTGSSNPSVFVWNVPTEKIRCCLSGHDGLVTGAAFLRGDDTKIVTGSHDHTLRIYDLPRSLCLKTIETKSAINAVLTGTFGILTALQDGSICRYDERTGKLESQSSSLHNRAILSAMYLPNTNEVITVSLDHTIKAVDLNTMSASQVFRHDAFRVPAEGGLPCLSSDEKFLVAGSSNGSLFVWNRAWNSELETILTGHDSSVVATLWSQKTNQLVSADRNGCIKVWK